MSKKYKKSQFNYECKTQNGYMIYNTMYNSLTRLSNEEYNGYLSETFGDSALLEQLISQGIVVETNVDELENYNTCIRIASDYEENKPNITITPTMECNARCFYCYEKGVRYGTMKKEDISKIIEFIKSLDYSKGINLTWFGGEPLMNQEWMDEFSEKLKKSNIEFNSFIITNGSKKIGRAHV